MAMLLVDLVNQLITGIEIRDITGVTPGFAVRRLDFIPRLRQFILTTRDQNHFRTSPCHLNGCFVADT